MPDRVHEVAILFGKPGSYPATGQVAIIRPYAKKPIFKGKEERISFNVFDEVKQIYESKFYAFTTSMMAFDLHRWHGYRVQFNDNPKYPQILECKEEMTVPTQPGREIGRGGGDRATT